MREVVDMCLCNSIGGKAEARFLVALTIQIREKIEVSEEFTTTTGRRKLVEHNRNAICVPWFDYL